MSGRGNRTAGSAGTEGAKERRRAAGQRVHFEAMVAVGGAEGGAAFEAESVDLSSDGMRLKTAYLPQLGDRLVCRFDGPGTEIIAVGEVTWATEQSRGGEFGLKFVDLDAETEQALRELCDADAEAVEAAPPADAPAATPSKPKVARNSRVKLHIEGLASPMKARVRDSDDAKVCVGSSLEFLKLGRQVEVEDVDAGNRREGFVDTVKVEIDPATSVPQLVVSLRFDAAAFGAVFAPGAGKDRRPADEAEVAPVTRVTGAPPSKRMSSPDDLATSGEEAPQARASLALTNKAGKKRESLPPPRTAKEEAAEAADAQDEDEMMPPNKLRAAQDKAKDLTNKAAAKIGPAFNKVGAGAKGFFASIRGTLDKRREARDEAKKANAPRRVTAPPPSGALTSEGRRVVRQDKEGAEDEAPPSLPQKKSKRGIYLGAAAGLALVIGVVGVSRALTDKADAPAATTSVASAGGKVVGVPPVPGAPANIDMPLYGPTPASTTEAVPPPPQAAVANKKADAEGSDDGGSAAADEGEDKGELVKEWSQGDVKGAKAFIVKMDSALENFSAVDNDNGFTITVPKHSSLTSSSAILKKDSRISECKVENREDAVDIHINFKGEVPAHKVKVRGDKLEIFLAGKGTPKADKSDKKKVAAKPASKKKKPAPKKK